MGLCAKRIQLPRQAHANAVRAQSSGALERSTKKLGSCSKESVRLASLMIKFTSCLLLYEYGRL